MTVMYEPAAHLEGVFQILPSWHGTQPFQKEASPYRLEQSFVWVRQGAGVDYKTVIMIFVYGRKQTVCQE